jgi:ribonucleoside-diphosphate reductase alpha chain
VKQADGETFSEYKVYHPLIQELFGGDENLPDYVVTAHQIDPYFRVRLQGVIQRYVDSSISSTVNLPEDVSLETVADIYITAYNAGLKGITVYREGSREGILITEKKAERASAVGAAAGSDAGGDPAAGPVPGAAQPPDLEGAGLRPRYRPAITRGRTERIRTGEGNIYVTINEDERGLCEVFTTIGKAGGNAAAQSEAISRLISLCLRSGVDSHEIVKQLKGISGPSPVWDNGDLVLSTPDAIGKAIERYLVDRDTGQGELFTRAADAAAEAGSQSAAGEPGERVTQARGSRVTPNRYGSAITTLNGKSGSGNPSGRRALPEEETATRLLGTCPDCGGSISHREGCLVCPSCGWSRC